MITETDKTVNGEAQIHYPEVLDNRVVHRIVLEKKCHQLIGHDHNYDHIFRVIHGPVNFWLCGNTPAREMVGVPQTMRDGDEVLVKAFQFHNWKALVDGAEIHCISYGRDADGNIIEVLTEIHQCHERGWV